MRIYGAQGPAPPSPPPPPTTPNLEAQIFAAAGTKLRDVDKISLAPPPPPPHTPAQRQILLRM